MCEQSQSTTPGQRGGGGERLECKEPSPPPQEPPRDASDIAPQHRALRGCPTWGSGWAGWSQEIGNKSWKGGGGRESARNE